MQTEINVVSAFRKYARYGYDNADFSIFEISDVARGAASNMLSACEIIAVYETLRTLEFTGKCETADAVRRVYFGYPERPLKKNEISWRVRRFAFEKHMDERTVYRHLKIAKDLFLKFCKAEIKNIEKI